jgi:hypothetical protein
MLTLETPAQLVEVINEDYADFVSLSTKLVNVDGAVLRMQRPLTEVQERLAGVERTLQVAAGPSICKDSSTTMLMLYNHLLETYMYAAVSV